MKKNLAFILTLVVMFILAGCSQAETDVNDTESTRETEAVETTVNTEPMKLRAIAPEGATTIAMLKMIHDQPEIGQDVEIVYESLNTTELLAADLMGEKTDFAIAPTNLAANLYSKGIPYTLVSVNTHGNLFMVTSLEIDSWDDIKGKTVYMIGQGLVPDLIFRYLAKENGIDPDQDITITYLGGSTEIAPAFLSGKAEIIIMPEPVLSVVSTKDVPFTVLFDFQEEYAKATGIEGGYPQSGLLVRNTLIETQPAVVKAFIEQLEASNTWVNENLDTAAVYMQDLDLGIPAPVAVKAIPGLNIRFESIADSKAGLEQMFTILFNAAPESIGGVLPDEAFYAYQAK